MLLKDLLVLGGVSLLECLSKEICYFSGNGKALVYGLLSDIWKILTAVTFTMFFTM